MDAFSAAQPSRSIQVRLENSCCNGEGGLHTTMVKCLYNDNCQTICSIHQQHIHAHNCLTAFCSGLPGWASTRRNIHPLTPILIIRHPSTKKSNKGLKWLFQQQRLVPWTQPVKMRRMMNVWRMALGEPSQHACIMTGVSSVNADQPIIATIITALAPQRSLR